MMSVRYLFGTECVQRRRRACSASTGCDPPAAQLSGGSTYGLGSRFRPDEINGFGTGEPDFHQLEPDGELAKPAPGTPKSRIV